MSLSEEDITDLCEENDWTETGEHLEYIIETYESVGAAGMFVMPMLLGYKTLFDSGARTDELKRDIWGIAL